MCVIVHKPRGATIRLRTLRQCWDANPDGAGVMFAHEGEVYGLKGLMKFEDLVAFLRSADVVEDGKVTAEIALTFHFRLATHGSVSPENCHPFPVSRDLADLTRTEWSAPMGVAHNGIIRDQEIPAGRSDTQAYIANTLSRRRGLPRFDKRTLANVAAETEGSRLLILRGDGRIERTGAWHKNSQGVLYSNLVWWHRAEERKYRRAERKRQAPAAGRQFPMFDAPRPKTEPAALRELDEFLRRTAGRTA